MNKKEKDAGIAAEKMIEGIDDKYIEEAALFTSGGKHTHTQKHFRRAVAAAVLCLAFAGVGVSVLAATNQKFGNWIQSNTSTENTAIEDFHTKDGGGVFITLDNDETDDDKIYYLTLNYIPDGYWCKDGEACLYYGSNTDTDFFTVNYLHLQADYANILGMAKSVKEYKTTHGTAYIAKSKWTTQAWLFFDDGPYMVKICDANKNLSKKQLHKLLDGASISTHKKNSPYEIIEWTKKELNSYMKWLKKYGQIPE